MAVVSSGPTGPVTLADLDDISALTATAFLNAVLELHAGDWCVFAPGCCSAD